MERSDRTWLIALLLLNLVLKCCWLGVNELAGDEPFTVFWSLAPVRDLFAMLHDENNPPLYFLVMKAWSSIVPLDEVWLRVPSAAFSALAVWPLFLLARKLGGIRLAITTSLLFTLSNYHFGFAHEVRAYSLFTLLSITGMWCLWRMKDGRGRPWMVLGLINVLLVYTHFFGWLMIGVQLLCTLLVKDLRSAHKPFVIATGIAALSYLPYAFIFFGRLGHSVSNGTWLTTPGPEELYNMIWRWSNAPVIAVLFLLVISVALVRSRLKDPAMQLALIWSFVPLIGMFLVSFLVPMFLDRYLVYAAPGFALLVGISLCTLIARPTETLGLCALGALGMLFTFKPWKDNGLHPSHVLQQVRKWNVEGMERTTILPYWYTLTFAAAEDINLLRDPYAIDVWKGMERSGIGGIDPVQPENGLFKDDSLMILVDAGAQYSERSAAVYGKLRSNFPRIDSVEADRKVWVYRFRK